MQVAGTCVFCGGTGLTKEHVWSDWLRALLPQTDDHFQESRGAFFGDFGDLPVSQEGLLDIGPFSHTKVSGPLRSIKLRLVCRGCNNGWMKKIVDEAKPIAKDLITNQARQINAEDQKRLTRWITLSMIMSGYITRKSLPVLNSFEERQKIFIHSETSPDWTICIGHYKGEEWQPLSFSTKHFIVSGEGEKIEEPFSEPSLYTIVRTYNLGSLFIHVHSVKKEGTEPFDFTKEFRARYIPRWTRVIFPAVHDQISCPTTPAIDDFTYYLIREKYYSEIMAGLVEASKNLP